MTALPPPAGQRTGIGASGGTGQRTAPPGEAPLRIERSPKRLRALLGGRLVFDTYRPALVWERRPSPTYYVEHEDVVARLEATGSVEHHGGLGDATTFDVHVGGRVARGAARVFERSAHEALRSLVRFEWDALDEWLEEDEPVYVHPRSPYVRVDVLASSRLVVLRLDGHEVARSDQPRILFETGLRPRYYLPLAHVHTELLVPSSTVTRCPYKGTASYWSLELGGRRYDDYAWCYRSPLPECAKIAGLICFFDERMELSVDGGSLPGS